MPAQAAAILLLSLLSIVTTFAGVLLATLVRGNAQAIAAGIGFSTGIMILISAFELIPQAYAGLELIATMGMVLLGAAILALGNLLLPHTHLVREHGLPDTRLVKSVYLIAFGLILHDVPEGFAMANAYIASPSAGLIVAIAIALHNLPEEMAMAIPAMALRDRKFLFGAAFLSALAEPLGAVMGLLAVAIEPSLNASFMAIAAGAMIFVSLHELLPMARSHGRPAWFVFGIALSIVVYRLVAGIVVAR